MSPGGHLVTTAAAGAAAYGATGSPALTAGLVAGGFLIDVDHAVDYVLFERQRDLRLHAFLGYYLSGRVKRTVLLLHSYEVAAVLALVAWATGRQWLWGYLLGMALHLPAAGPRGHPERDRGPSTVTGKLRVPRSVAVESPRAWIADHPAASLARAPGRSRLDRRRRHRGRGDARGQRCPDAGDRPPGRRGAR